MPAARRLENPTASATKISRVCGSEVTLDILVEDDQIIDFGIEAKACALGQASASIVARNIIGAPIGELTQLRDEMRAMLKDDGPAASGARWEDLGALKVIKDYPQRHASVMLVFEALVLAIKSLSPPDKP